MNMNWINCEKEMPQEGKPVIGWFYNGDYPVYAFHEKGEWRAELGMHTLVFQNYAITHWMPLPPRPL